MPNQRRGEDCDYDPSDGYLDRVEADAEHAAYVASLSAEAYEPKPGDPF